MLPFPGRDGLGVRVAVIDSGVNPRHPHISRIAGGVSIGSNAEIEEGTFLDVMGHGTAVMAAIQDKAPAAEYFAVKVFHTALRTSSLCLLRAMEWAIENRMDVVNLSLGTPNSGRAEEFRSLAARGPALVAARDADGSACYPGCLPEVFGVALDPECPRDLYRVADGVYYASGFPRPIPGVSPARNLQGISFAVANMTGFIARALEGRTAETLRAELSTASAP
jgi:subtilisin family serine protease